MGEITVPDDAAPLNATVKFLDAEGHEATPDDTPQWSSTDDSVASVSASDDGMTGRGSRSNMIAKWIYKGKTYQRTIDITKKGFNVYSFRVTFI